MAKRITNKDKEAKEKVANLLKDSKVLTKEEPKKDKLKEASDKHNTDWLQDQLDALTKENEELLSKVETLQNDYEKLFNDFTALKNSPAVPAGSEELQNGIMGIFKDLENNYLGNNIQRTRYTDAKIKVLLDKFVSTFKFLQHK